MDSKQSLYNKYRPTNFHEVVGQDVAKDILMNSIAKNKINHAYLFYGIRGTGKTTLARIFAKTINCKGIIDNNPCNKCKMCEEINNGSAFDIIEIDAASNNGVNEIRIIKENTTILTTNSTYKVYIIDEVHMLTKQAFNALLKTLEEPPKNTIFLLATTEMHKIPKTVLSRTVTVNLEVLSNENLKKGIKVILDGEKIHYDEQSIEYISLVSGGSLRDAISALEAVLLFNNELNVQNVIKALGLVDKNDLKNLLENDINKLIEVIDTSEKDYNKILFIMLEVLTELIKNGNLKFIGILDDLIDAANNINDPSLLKLSIQAALLKFNVSRETLKESLDVENPISTANEENLIQKKELKKEENVMNKEENSLIKDDNLTENKEKMEPQKSKKIEENSNVENIEPKLDSNLNIITDFVDVNNYMYAIAGNKEDKLSSIKLNWKYIENHITSLKYKDVVSALINTDPLAINKNTLIVGFENKQQINEFKRISLSSIYFEFIKEIIGEYIFILPISEENWNKLIAVNSAGYKLSDKNTEINLKYDLFIESEEDKKTKALNDIFGEENIKNE